ncbi:MAG: class I SAM-dependent methyltransferase [Anaerolineae bacterium]
MFGWVALITGILITSALLYWLLILTEGAYLGPRVVILLYDLTAHRYNRLKEYDADEEDYFLGRPLAQALGEHPAPWVLDVATGTGRLPLTLLRQTGFEGQIVALDRSARMLAIARQDLAEHAGRCRFLVADAEALPFADQCFSAVSCLEALEFLAHPQRGLRELIRVLQGRGWLLATNRIGWEAYLMPGKTWARDEVMASLSQLPLAEIAVRPWQVIYDIIWARKRTAPVTAAHRNR